MSKKDSALKLKELKKWHLVRLWFKELRPQHFKYCICICPKRKWFFFINSDPPLFRKARELALEVSSFEVTPLRKDSFIDTTDLIAVPDDGRVEDALKEDGDGHYGAISPSLKKKLLEKVREHNALTDEQRTAILAGEDET